MWNGRCSLFLSFRVTPSCQLLWVVFKLLFPPLDTSALTDSHCGCVSPVSLFYCVCFLLFSSECWVHKSHRSSPHNNSPSVQSSPLNLSQTCSFVCERQMPDLKNPMLISKKSTTWHHSHLFTLHFTVCAACLTSIIQTFHHKTHMISHLLFLCCRRLNSIRLMKSDFCCCSHCHVVKLSLSTLYFLLSLFSETLKSQWIAILCL